jgi:hypothetical protein
MRPTRKLTTDQRFFFDWAGWSYKPGEESPAKGRTRGAVRLAAAEAYARKELWHVTWERESQPDVSWCVECENGNHDTYKHMNAVECAVLYGADGKVLDSLGNIDRPSAAYRRVVAAELALEAMPEGAGQS